MELHNNGYQWAYKLYKCYNAGSYNFFYKATSLIRVVI